MASAFGSCLEGEEEEGEEEELSGEGGGNVLPAVISGPSQLFLWCPMVYPMLESGKEGMPVDLSKPTTISLLVPAQALQRTLRALSPDQKSYHLDPEMLLGPSKAQFLEIRFMVSCTPGEDRCRMTDGSLGATTAQAAAAAADAFGGPSASASALSPLS